MNKVMNSIILAGAQLAAQGLAGEVLWRDGVGNFRAKALAGGPVKVAYLGGSITEMTGWRNLTTEWLGREFPQATVEEIAASIGGTGSDLGVFRVGHDALDHDPDLLFVEFATNDSTRSPDAIVRQIEGIVRQTWTRNAKTDIVFVYTVTATTLRDYMKGGVPRAVVAMEKVADHYGIPSVDFGPRILGEVAAGRLVMSPQELETDVPVGTPDRDKVIADKLAAEGKTLFAPDGVHPFMAGHEFYLKSVQAFFAKTLNDAPCDHTAKMALPPVDPMNLSAAKMVAITQGMLKGEWSKSQAMNANGRFVARMDEIWEADTPGAKLCFVFDGTHCDIYDLLGPDGGQVWITVDGKRAASPFPRFDSYCTYHRIAHLPVFDGAPGRHTVEIEVDSKQPDRQSVAFRLQDPAVELAGPKYNGTKFWPAKIMVVGDVVDGVLP